MSAESCEKLLHALMSANLNYGKVMLAANLDYGKTVMGANLDLGKAVVTANLDFGKAFVWGLQESCPSVLQHVQSTACRLVSQSTCKMCIKHFVNYLLEKNHFLSKKMFFFFKL